MCNERSLDLKTDPLAGGKLSQKRARCIYYIKLIGSYLEDALTVT
jgi:hypothetical protein